MHDRGSARRPWAPSALRSGSHARPGCAPQGPLRDRRGARHGLAALWGAWAIGAADPALASEVPERAAETASEPDARDASSGSAASDEGAAEPSTSDEASAGGEPPTGDDASVEPAKTDDASAEPDDAEAASDASAEPAKTDGAAASASEPAAPAPRPPRIDGTYLGGTALLGVGLARVNDFDTDGAFASFGGTFTVGQMVFPWLGLGLHGGGGGGVSSKDGVRQKLGQGHLGVQFKFVPLPKRRVPLSLLATFGFGGGAVRQEGIAKRSGFGGAQFGAAVRYELFPWAQKRRPYRGGGFGLGPELGWVGFTPAASGRPMLNVVYLALSATFYFGD